MINYYDPNFQGVHVIRVTFMQWDYIGHVAFEIGGNCKGAELMDFTFWSVTTKKILTAILKMIVSSVMMKKMKFIPLF